MRQGPGADQRGGADELALMQPYDSDPAARDNMTRLGCRSAGRVEVRVVGISLVGSISYIPTVFGFSLAAMKPSRSWSSHLPRRGAITP